MPGQKVSRRDLTALFGRRSLHTSDQRLLAQEIAAYLLETGRTAELDSLLRDLIEYRAVHQVVEVSAVSSHPLDKPAVADIRHKLQQLYGAADRILINNRIDQRMLAGVKLELPGRQLDLTARAKLDTLKQLTGKER